jgi:hypothetical protein
LKLRRQLGSSRAHLWLVHIGGGAGWHAVSSLKFHAF